MQRSVGYPAVQTRHTMHFHWALRRTCAVPVLPPTVYVVVLCGKTAVAIVDIALLISPKCSEEIWAFPNTLDVYASSTSPYYNLPFDDTNAPDTAYRRYIRRGNIHAHLQGRKQVVRLTDRRLQRVTRIPHTSRRFPLFGSGKGSCAFF